MLQAIEIVSKAEMKESLARKITGTITLDNAKSGEKAKDGAKILGV